MSPRHVMSNPRHIIPKPRHHLDEGGPARARGAARGAQLAPLAGFAPLAKVDGS